MIFCYFLKKALASGINQLYNTYKYESIST